MDTSVGLNGPSRLTQFHLQAKMQQNQVPVHKNKFNKRR
jgi:hypothetical protein